MSSFGPAVYAITDSGVAELEAAAMDLLGDQQAAILRTRAENDGVMIRHL
jgi:predicted sugar kinase